MDYAELIRAHALYESKYGNNFYRIALNVCQRGGIEEKTTAVASFLIYFNKVWYMHSDDGKNAFNNLEKHVSDIYEVIRTTNPIIEELKDISIIDANLDDAFIESSIKTLYKKFSNVFGATGASKALHLLHPKLFVMWDDNIRRSYQIDAPDENGYLRFLKMAKEEIVKFIKSCAEKNGLSFEDAERLIKEKTGIELTKLLDELNYLRYTRKEFIQKVESSNADKIAKVLKIIDEIVRGAYEASRIDWVVKTNRSGMVKASADKLKRVVEMHAKKGDLEGILKYLQNVLNDPTGKEVYKVLKACGKKTVEDVYDKIVRIARS